MCVCVCVWLSLNSFHYYSTVSTVSTAFSYFIVLTKCTQSMLLKCFLFSLYKLVRMFVSVGASHTQNEKKKKNDETLYSYLVHTRMRILRLNVPMSTHIYLFFLHIINVCVCLSISMALTHLLVWVCLRAVTGFPIETKRRRNYIWYCRLIT